MSPRSSLPLITVAGAASKQGRSVAAALLASGRYRVRALARSADSAPIRELARRGAEIVVVPLEAGRRDELAAAMRGSHGAFLMTPPVAPVPPPGRPELALGIELADAALAAGVEHVVWSSLENVEARTGDTQWAPHFTEKALVEAHLRTLPLRSSFIQLAFFYSNFLEYYVPRPQADGSLSFAVYLPPDAPMPFVDPLTATGPAVLAHFDDPEAYHGQTLPVIGEVLTAREIVDIFVRVTGRRAHYASAYARDDLLVHFPAFGADAWLVREIVGMVTYAVDHGYYAPERDTAWSRRNDPDALTWEGFLRRTGWQGEPTSFGAATRTAG
ncbi:MULTISPECIES: NmrA/HSCARG family protein [unclassified Rhizobacter]|uniref:NmrA/HSCARG family protein n=1 Tax=unclassified Rhizobacter TaxID=2640088 RepID=UPI0006FFA288|nr:MULTISPECIES: NmrA/HSCARG family protein [unclassified Rhizobacter]KQU80833.1 NmrA family protein [Rhizobacter sp. Root29]KQW04376.1 NmrA family protein [Rhizobacter sp. Root1238]KRB14493.1 NmrA family protein [Rhizobacter sp. Root16D2]